MMMILILKSNNFCEIINVNLILKKKTFQRLKISRKLCGINRP